jgi:AraC-like DNA-binding protein
MDLICDERPSDSPLVESIWRSQSDQAAPFISMADNHFALVFTKYAQHATLTVRGPETQATSATGLAGVEFLGIRFKPGVFMPDLPPGRIMDRLDPNLPAAGQSSFWLHGSVWQIPDFENADTFVDRLARDGLLVQDALVENVSRGVPAQASLRTLQRRFLQATGLTASDFHQIERARFATALLKEGSSILETVYQAGYFDQPHLTRSLRRLIGLTPAQVLDRGRAKSLSFLYKTIPFAQYILYQQEDNYEKNSRI